MPEASIEPLVCEKTLLIPYMRGNIECQILFRCPSFPACYPFPPYLPCLQTIRSGTTEPTHVCTRNPGIHMHPGARPKKLHDGNTAGKLLFLACKTYITAEFPMSLAHASLTPLLD